MSGDPVDLAERYARSEHAMLPQSCPWRAAVAAPTSAHIMAAIASALMTAALPRSLCRTLGPACTTRH
jgi:hypothetical protein